MNKIIKFTPPAQLMPISEVDKELRKYGIPEHARADAEAVVLAFCEAFKVPAGEFSYQLPAGITDEQFAEIDQQLKFMLGRYHDAWRLALANFAGSLHEGAVRAAMGIKPRET